MKPKPKPQPTPESRTILVCGDLVWDTHIARVQNNLTGYSRPHLQSQLETRKGGAWYLGEMIELSIKSVKAQGEERVNKISAAIAKKTKAPIDSPRTSKRRQQRASEIAALRQDLRYSEKLAADWAAQFKANVKVSDEIPENDLKAGRAVGVAKAFSVWGWSDGKEKLAKASVAEDETVGFKWSAGSAEPGAWRIKEFLGCQEYDWKKKGQSRKSPSTSAVVPDVLVIDDLGLGFAKQRRLWPKCLKPGSASLPAQIIAKLKPPFTGPLWRRLSSPDLVSKLTVVITAAALRRTGARLSRGFSWDQAIEDVQEEFKEGGVGWALRKCRRVVVTFGRSGAAVFSRVPRSPEEKFLPSLEFERFVFDPANLEGTWAKDRTGITYGATSVMTAALTTWALVSSEPSSHVPVSRGLAAARELHRIGGGHREGVFDLQAAHKHIFADKTKTRSQFRSAFPRTLLDDLAFDEGGDVLPPERQTLLTDVLGVAPSFLATAARSIVWYGPERPLKSVPRLEYGKYFTVDREEIERLNTVRNLIVDYSRNDADKRPLSLAVFGPPGAGKSFAIKELSTHLFGKERAALEFNLSQFEGLDDLHQAFHEVRGQSVQGQIPLVFWDEFDSPRDKGGELGWLKEFLAPMQDAQFVANGKGHAFGKCIFIFAGGTRGTFGEFIAPLNPVEDEAGLKVQTDFKSIKGPDFVSRLRGYVNIKGPNPTSNKRNAPENAEFEPAAVLNSEDEVHVIRRALLLRSLIERHHKTMIQADKRLAIGPTVLNAFLTVREYRYGARSMDAIVSLSRLSGSHYFGPSELPPPEVVELHVSEDFFDKVKDRESHDLGVDEIERLARIIHENWYAINKSKGYVYGETRNDKSKPPTHPLFRDYDELSEEEKEGNRRPALLTTQRLKAMGCDVVAGNQGVGGAMPDARTLPPAELGRAEHRRWMREKLVNGMAYGLETNDDLLLHKDLSRLDFLSGPEQRLHDSLEEAIKKFLANEELALARTAVRRCLKQAAASTDSSG